MLDPNGTRFHLVLSREDWGLPAEGAPGGLRWSAADVAATLPRRAFLFPARPSERPLGPADRRGAARDRHGHWYWIDDDGARLRFLGEGMQGSEPFWPGADPACLTGAAARDDEFAPEAPPAPAALALSGLAVTNDHYLVVGVTAPWAGLLVFDLAGGGSPLELRWPRGVPFAPFDMAPAPDGGVWVLDAAHRAYWALDRWFRVRRAGAAPGAAPPAGEPFTPEDAPVASPRARCVPPALVTADLAIPVAVDAPVAIEALPDGTVLVLGAGPAGGRAPTLVRYDGAERVGVLTDDLARELAAMRVPGHLLRRAHDLAFVAGDAGAGTLFVVGPDGNQAFGFALAYQPRRATVSLTPAYWPMRHFGGRALVAAGGAAWYDADGRWVMLAEQPRPAYLAEGACVLPPPDAVGTGVPAYDGRDPGCVWHRLLLDACIPPDTDVTVESRAADDLEELDAAPWDEEPGPYLRRTGSELPGYAFEAAAGASAASRARTGTWELLFQRARGRWLQLRLTLRGPGRLSPRVRAVRAYYPRFSYLTHYLPAVFRDDPASAGFLDRWLANVEGTFTDVEARIAEAQALFDVRTTPAAYLDWLASWLGATLDASWPERTRRLVLAHAPQLYRERGTRAGLARMLRIALDPCPDESIFDDAAVAGAGCATCGASAGSAFGVRIVEHFLLRRAADAQSAREVARADAWEPADGAAALHARYRAWLAGRYASPLALAEAWALDDADGYTTFDDTRIRLASVRPEQVTRAADWARFMGEELAIRYALPEAEDVGAWRAFLAARYRDAAALTGAYGIAAGTIDGFDDVCLPAELPTFGAALADWMEFVRRALPGVRSAHRFSVLVPVAIDDDEEAQRRRRDVAERVTGAEKPAHTRFDVQLYWALFRAGEARLGVDTQLGHGSRFAAVVLGRAALAAGYLSWTEPWSVRGRMVVGRDPVTAARTP